MITAEYELTTHVRICTVFIVKQENAVKVKVKVTGKIKPGKTFGNIRDKCRVNDEMSQHRSKDNTTIARLCNISLVCRFPTAQV